MFTNGWNPSLVVYTSIKANVSNLMGRLSKKTKKNWVDLLCELYFSI